jgi:drug/metabolite transporter (DMT)-like permease
MTVGGLMLVSYKPGSLAKGPSSDGALADQTAAQPDVLPHGFLTIRERVLRSALLLGLGSSLAYAVGNVLRGAAVRSWNEPVLGALVGALCGLALHLVFTSDNSGLVARLRSSDRSGCYLFALVGLCNISGQICVIGSMRYIPLTVATLMTLCTPILVFPLSYLFLKKQDDMTLTTVLGGVLTLLGIFIIVMR